MNKRISVILFSVFVTLFSMAKDVAPFEAVNKATSFMARHLSQDEMEIQSMNAVQHEGKNAYYIIQFRNGWILISADDTSDPVIGYSSEGVFATGSEMPDNLRSWLSVRAQAIRHIASQTTARSIEWDREPVVTRASADVVSPLISVHWNQGRPYNTFCPTINGVPTVVGCVAVAMAQAMSVHRYPERPQGDFSYVHSKIGTIHVNYDKEPAYDWEKIMTGSDGKQELARFLYHVGVSVQMDYGTSAMGGSGTRAAYIPVALQRNFGYSTTSIYYSRESYSGDWKALLLGELKSGRAVCYSGHDPKKGYGHCFNIDGYDGSAFFHLNWGWGGYGDGYFSIDALRDATMDMNYSVSQGVVVGIKKPSAQDKPVSDDITDILIENTEVAPGKPAGTVVDEVIVVSNAKNPSYAFKVASGSITVKTVPFEIKNGKLVTKSVLTEGTKSIKITVTNTNNNKSFTKKFDIVIKTPPAEHKVEDVNYDGVVDTQDILTIYGYIESGVDTASPPQDVNGDGVVDTQDVLLVYDYIQKH